MRMVSMSDVSNQSFSQLVVEDDRDREAGTEVGGWG